jgi:hypothetical protein
MVTEISSQSKLRTLSQTFETYRVPDEYFPQTLFHLRHYVFDFVENDGERVFRTIHDNLNAVHKTMYNL